MFYYIFFIFLTLDSTVSKEEPPQPSSNSDILEKEVISECNIEYSLMCNVCSVFVHVCATRYLVCVSTLSIHFNLGWLENQQWVTLVGVVKIEEFALALWSRICTHTHVCMHTHTRTRTHVNYTLN